MIQAVERLELPADTYNLLEQMALARQLTPSEFVTDMLRQFQAAETLALLREEYHQLTEKALRRTITHNEEKRVDAIYAQMNTINRQAEKEYIREQRDRKADALIEKAEHLLDLVCQQSTR